MVDEIVGEAAGFLFRQVGGLAVELTVDHIFSRHTARFFHGIGRRLIAMLTLGRARIPTSLRTVPKGMSARPRRSDWLALWVGILFWVALFFGIGLGVSHFL
jgi:type VI protein secretion system component VasF